MNEPWRIRPHHGLCIHFFAGKGYSAAFVNQMAAIVSELKMNPDRNIILHNGTDFLCKSCPHNLNETCETEQKVAQYDHKCLTLCGLKNGQILPWKEFQVLVMKEIILPGRLPKICADCCWSGICQHSIVENSVQSVESL